MGVLWDQMFDGANDVDVLDELAALPEWQRNLMAIHIVFYDWANGAFHQVYSNSTGEVVPEAIQAYRAVGLGDAAGILERTLDVFGDKYSREQSARREFLGSLVGESEVREDWDPFIDLDVEYSRLTDRAAYGKALDDYVEFHAR